jgi:hypothetical protein
LVATLDVSAARYVVGGKLAANLELVGSRQAVNEGFDVHAARSPFATFGGVVGIVLLLIVAAYAESMLRSLRRGRRRDNRANVAGMVMVGAFGGLTAALWGWMFGISAPDLTGLIIPAAVGAVAGLLIGLAALQVGERARAHRQANRLVLVARRKAVPSPEPAPAGAQS